MDRSSVFDKEIEENFGQIPMPVQLIFSQRLDGTLNDAVGDGWFHDDDDDDDAERALTRLSIVRSLSMLAQVTFGIAIGFDRARLVHNDLHGGNLAYERVPDDRILYYSIGKQYMAVPTYGHVWKEIDFGRSSFILPVSEDRIVVKSNTPARVSKRWDVESSHNDLLRLVSVFALLIQLDDSNDLLLLNPYDFDIQRLAYIFHSILSCDGPSELLTQRLTRECRHLLDLKQEEEWEHCRRRVFDVGPYLTTSNCRHGIPNEILGTLIGRYSIPVDRIPPDAIIYELSSSPSS